MSYIERIKSHYQIGAIVRPSFGGGFDKVIDLAINGEWWAVQVVACTANGQPLRGERPRWHSTAPA